MRYEDRELATILNKMQALAGFRPAYELVYVTLTAWTNSTTNYTEPSQSKIAEELGMARETVCRAVKWLRPRGFLRTIQLPNWMDGNKLRGRLRYWTTRERGQIAWLKRKLLSSIHGSNSTKCFEARRPGSSETTDQATRQNTGSYGKTRSSSSTIGLPHTSSGNGPSSAIGHDASASNESWLTTGRIPPSRLLERVYGRCDLQVTSKSRTEPYSDDVVVPDENSASPQLELALRKGRWRS